MPRLVLPPAVRRDISDLLAYLVRQGADRRVARLFVTSLRQQCEKLAGLPGTLGTPRPDLAEGVRSFPYRGYVIFFIYGRGSFRVLRIIEGHRDMPQHIPSTT